MFTPWSQPPQQKTPRQIMLERLANGVPPELVCRAHQIDKDVLNADPEAVIAMAEGEILLFERARDSGVTGIVRSAMRYESKSWAAKAEGQGSGTSLEDLLRE